MKLKKYLSACASVAALCFCSGLAQAQTIIDVAGAGVIGDEILTTDAGVAKVPANGSNWKTPGAAAGGGNTAESFLVSPDITVPAGGLKTLRFSHRYFFEGGWDGGAVFVSVDGAEATYVPSASFTAGAYDGVANLGTAWNGGELVFTGQSLDYGVPTLVDSVVDLSGLGLVAGQTISVEFRAIWDEGYFEPDTNWEVATVTLEDSADAPFFDVDFTTDGKSDFTVASNATVNGGAWTYVLPINTFEADIDTPVADRYKPDGVSPPNTIDLNGAAIKIEVLTGTLDIGDTITIFDLSGGTTLTGSFGSVTLPGGVWDTSTLESNGTITCLDAALPLIYEPFADLNSSLNGNTPGLGMTGTWSSNANVADGSLKYGKLGYQGGRQIPGASVSTGGVSPGTTLTDAGLLADGATLWFSVLVKKYPDTSVTTNDRTTYFSLGTGAPDGFDRIGGNTGNGFAMVVNQNNAGLDRLQGWNNNSATSGGAFRSPLVSWGPEGSTLLLVGKITWGAFNATPALAVNDVFELYVPDKDLNLGPVVSTLNGNFDQLGVTDPAKAFDTIGFGGKRGAAGENNTPEIDEFRFAADVADVLPLDFTDPLLVTTDNASGSSTQRSATFDEEVYAGSGDIRIVNETNPATTTITLPDPQVVVSGNTLTITPTVALSAGDNYHIEIDAGALTDRNLNDFAGISDPLTWAFLVDGTPPTVVSFGDNTSPLPVLTNTSALVYTVTFSEPMDAGTVDATDFAATAGSVPITVDSVSATGDPAVFKVAVSTLGTTGTLRLEIVQDAVIRDSNTLALDTSVAIPSDNTLTVNDPVPTAADMFVDFQATIASEQHPTYAGEARYFHVSVNPDNAGTGSYAATVTGSPDNIPAPAFVRNYTGPVVAYKFLGGTNNSITGVTGSGGEPDRITYATEDAAFDGFGQQQLRLWATNDPGTDLMIGATEGATGFDNIGNFGYRSFGGAIGTIDISGLESGSLHIYYGAFSATPSVKVTLKDTDNVAADLVLSDAHAIANGGNGDAANRTEYYLAEIDFVTDGFYDVIEFEWLANGVDYTGNGRGLGVVLTGPDVLDDYSTWAKIFAPADLTDPDADLDMDGRTNDEERLFGTDPTDTASLDPYSAPLSPGAGTFSFTRRDNALTGKLTDIETSFDLEMWTVDNGAVLVDNGPDANGVEIVDVTLSPGLLSAPKLFVRVNQNDGILFSENFENGDGGFTLKVVDAAGSPWEWGAPESSGLGGSVTEGNGGSTNCWGTSLGDTVALDPGYYINPTMTCLRSVEVDLTNVAAATLTFAEALDMEQDLTLPDDVAVVNIINATTDDIIAAAIYTATDGDPATSDWEVANGGTPIEIPAAALGQKVRIEWCFTGQADDYFGWYIDDVTVQRVAP